MDKERAIATRKVSTTPVCPLNDAATRYGRVNGFYYYSRLVTSATAENH